MITTRLIAAAAGLAALLAAGSARADCFDEAAKYHKVNPLILRAIAWQESHNRPDALHKNDNGSTDYGVMQINSVHLPTLAQYGISTNTLMQPCKNVYIAAWHLRRQMNKYGNTWQAVGAYHSETPVFRDKYASQIAAILRQWKLMPQTAPGAQTTAVAATKTKVKAKAEPRATLEATVTDEPKVASAR